MSGPSGLLALLQTRRWIAAALVTVITLLLIGGVLVATTSFGCSATKSVGWKLARCAGTNTAAHLQATPSFPPAKPGAPPPPSNPPATEPASGFPPNTNPASGYPPNPNPGSGFPPNQPPASGADPFYPPSSGGPPPKTLNCRLPIYAGPPGSGGFVLFPEGNFIADPRSAVSLPAQSPGSPSPAPNGPYQGYGPGPGYGQGYYGMTYDRLHTRWLPVSTNMAAPDGNHYAYPSTNSIYLVDPANNTQVELGAGHGWIVIRVENDRVYATIPNQPGFWVVPFSGTPRQVTTSGYWQAATTTAAYGTLTSAVPQGAATKLMKLDIASGTITDWFTRDGTISSVTGFDQNGHPIVYGYFNGGWALWLTKSPTDASVIANSYEQFGVNGTPVSDGNGVWFPAYYSAPYNNLNGPGIVLWAPGSGIYWMTSVGGQLAGGCV